MLVFCLESKTENAVRQSSRKVSRKSFCVCDQRATEEGRKRFENNPFLCMVPYENEDMIDTMKYRYISWYIVHYFHPGKCM